MRKRHAAKGLSLVFALCFLALVGWAVFLLWRQEAHEAQRTELMALHDQARPATQQDAPTYLPVRQDAAPTPTPYIDPLSLENPDYAGWLTVYSTAVDYPVVLRDNDYYLHHDFYGNYDANGCLFLDEATDLSEPGNLLIYGHHMKSGAMFATLVRFKETPFFAEHGLIRWEYQGTGAYYEIFAMLVIPGDKSATDYFPIQDYLNRQDEETTAELLAELQRRALLWREIELENTDTFLFLATCDYTRSNGRLLICAKRLSK